MCYLITYVGVFLVNNTIIIIQNHLNLKQVASARLSCSCGINCFNADVFPTSLSMFFQKSVQSTYSSSFCILMTIVIADETLSPVANSK